MKKPMSHEEALAKIRRYCAYQERAHQEVRAKLHGFGLPGRQVEELIAELITSGFLNEERFAKAFAGGKFRMKQWGRIKIVLALEGRGVSSNCIRMGLREIPEEDYRETLKGLLRKKNEEIDEPDLYLKRDRLSKFAIQRGFEPDIVWSTLRTILPDR